MLDERETSGTHQPDKHQQSEMQKLAAHLNLAVVPRTEACQSPRVLRVTQNRRRPAAWYSKKADSRPCLTRWTSTESDDLPGTDLRKPETCRLGIGQITKKWVDCYVNAQNSNSEIVISSQRLNLCLEIAEPTAPGEEVQNNILRASKDGKISNVRHTCSIPDCSINSFREKVL
jgi:hypothetical protein